MSQASNPPASNTRSRKRLTDYFERKEQPKRPRCPGFFSAPVFSEEDAKSYTRYMKFEDGDFLKGGMNFGTMLRKQADELAKSLAPDGDPVCAAEFIESEVNTALDCFAVLIKIADQMYNLYHSWVLSTEMEELRDPLAGSIPKLKQASCMIDLAKMVDTTDNPKAQQVARRLIEFYGKACLGCNSLHRRDRVVLACGHIVCKPCCVVHTPGVSWDVLNFSSTSEMVVTCILCKTGPRDVVAVQSDNSPAWLHTTCATSGCASHGSFITPLYHIKTFACLPICLPCVFRAMRLRFIDDVGALFLADQRMMHEPDDIIGENSHLIPYKYCNTTTRIQFTPLHRNAVFRGEGIVFPNYAWERRGVLYLLNTLENTHNHLLQFIVEQVLSHCSGFCRRSVTMGHPIRKAYINYRDDCYHTFCKVRNAYTAI